MNSGFVYIACFDKIPPGVATNIFAQKWKYRKEGNDAEVNRRSRMLFGGNPVFVFLRGPDRQPPRRGQILDRRSIQ